MFSDTKSYLARCQSRSKARNKRMSAVGPDSILLGFMPDYYLHVSILSPRCINGATRDFFFSLCCLQISEVSQRRGPQVMMIPFSSLPRNLMWVPATSLTTGKGTKSANITISNHKQFLKHSTTPNAYNTDRMGKSNTCIQRQTRVKGSK